jgi:hypothetical protein
MSATWQALGCSVKGVSHERKNFPNQDAIDWRLKDGESDAFTMALSDGHGDKKYFRSAIGAELAVQSALSAMEELLLYLKDSLSTPQEITKIVSEYLPRSIVQLWKKRVSEHLESNPFQPDELKGIDEKKLEKNNLVAYGATLIGVLATEYFIVYLQLGDGDIICVQEDREIYRPIPSDSRLIGNQTPSLCSPEPLREFRLAFQTLAGLPPVLILLSTDGYANSFTTEADFLKVGIDYLDMIQREGISKVNEQLEDILNETTKAGSGDDVTVGILVRKTREEA